MATYTGGHPRSDALELYAIGNLPEDAVAGIEEHILICRHCQVRLEETEQFIAVTKKALQVMGEERRQPQKQPGSFWAWAFRVPTPVWAGACAVFLITMLLPVLRQAATGPIATTEVVLSTSRGRGEAHAAPGALLLIVDVSQLRQLPAYSLKLVREDGSEVWHGPVQPSNATIRQQVPKIVAVGRYWVRIYSADGSDLLREFALEVK